MSSDSTDEGEVSHNAYPVIRTFPYFHTKIVLLCHHAERNDIFMLGGRVSFRNLSQILLGQCENFWGIYGIFHLLLIVL